jgi:hypothetical protein
MKKLILILLTFVAAGFVLQHDVHAQQAGSSYTVSFQVDAGGDGALNIKQNVTVKNTSNQYLLSKLNINFPYPVTGLRAYQNGVPVGGSLDGNALSIDLDAHPIGLNEERQLEIDYSLSNRIEQIGSFRRILLPNFQLDLPVQISAYNFSYPLSWGDISYCSNNYNQLQRDQNRINIQITDPGSQILLSIGRANFAGVNASWTVTNPSPDSGDFLVPVPDSGMGRFHLKKVSGADTGYIDDKGNHFLLVKLGNKEQKSGTFSGYYEQQQPELTDNKSTNGFYQGVADLDLGAEQNLTLIYNKVLQKLTPATAASFERRGNISHILQKPSQSSLDYATVLTGVLRSKGIPAEVVYGYVNFPLTSKYLWHFWVLYKEGSVWRIADPFMQAVTGFASFGQVTPERVPWGILPDSEDGAKLVSASFSPDNLISFQNEGVEGISSYSKIITILNLAGKAYSAESLPLELEVHNGGDTAINLAGVTLAGIDLDPAKLVHYWILPQTSQKININGVVLNDPFYEGHQHLQGKLSYTDAGKKFDQELGLDVSFEVNKSLLYLNTGIILSGFLLCSFLLKRNFPKLRLFLKNLTGQS